MHPFYSSYIVPKALNFFIFQNKSIFQNSPINRNTKQIFQLVSYEFLLAEPVLSNPNPKIYVGLGCIKLVQHL